MIKQTQERETFRISAELMKKLRIHFMEKARSEGKDTYYGILQTGIEEILREYLNKQEQGVKYEAENIK